MHVNRTISHILHRIRSRCSICEHAASQSATFHRRHPSLQPRLPLYSPHCTIHARATGHVPGRDLFRRLSQPCMHGLQGEKQKLGAAAAMCGTQLHARPSPFPRQDHSRYTITERRNCAGLRASRITVPSPCAKVLPAPRTNTQLLWQRLANTTYTQISEERVRAKKQGHGKDLARTKRNNVTLIELNIKSRSVFCNGSFRAILSIAYHPCRWRADPGNGEKAAS